MSFLYVFVLIFFYKLLSNLSRMILVRFYQKKYERYISKHNFDFSAYTYSVKKLFERANIHDGLISYSQPAGYGYVEHGHATLFENMEVFSSDVASMMNRCFSRAFGTYRSRVLECISPLYWIDCVVFLPQKFLTSLGVKADGLLVKIFQLLYWLFAPLALVFRADIYSYIAELIGKVQQIP